MRSRLSGLLQPVLVIAFAAGSAFGQAASATPSPAIEPCTPAPSPVLKAPASKPDVTIKSRASQTEINSSVAADPGVEAAVNPYVSKVRELAKPIGTLEAPLKKTGMGGGGMGNLVADAILAEARRRTSRLVLIGITNTGGIRKNDMAAGEIATTDIFELLPFENALVVIDLTGAQLRDFLAVLVSKRDAQSGARIEYRTGEDGKTELAGVEIRSDGGAWRKLDPSATYAIVTSDYLVNRGGDYKILQGGKRVEQIGLTLRDAVIAYIKSETEAGRKIRPRLDGRFSQKD